MAYTFSRAALREIDRRAVEEYHIPILVLMENAGRAVADTALKMLQPGAAARIVCGPGNNGGDGLVAARHLHNAGVAVELFLTAAPEHFRDAAAPQLAIARAMRLPIIELDAEATALRETIDRGGASDLLIDAIFGTGLSRPVAGLPAASIAAINTSGRTVLAVDLPSGLDCDTGQPLGTAVRATRTVSFCGLKKGFAGAEAFTGSVSIGDIGAPCELLAALAQKSTG